MGTNTLQLLLGLESSPHHPAHLPRYCPTSTTERKENKESHCSLNSLQISPGALKRALEALLLNFVAVSSEVNSHFVSLCRIQQGSLTWPWHALNVQSHSQAIFNACLCI